MSEDFKDDSETGEGENFAELFESYSNGMNEDVQVGDKIKGKIISIGKDTVFVDTGTKVDGAVDKAELLGEDQRLPLAVGDLLELYVIAANENEIRLSKAISGIGGMNLLHEAFEGEIPVEGRVNALCKGGFHVDILQRRAFCPISQMDLKYVETPEDYVGETYQFIIKQLEDKGRNIVVSRRELLGRQQEKEKKAFYEALEVGALLQGRVVRLMPYGAFVELVPGIEGMVHISELSWSRVENSADVCQPGDAIQVKVIGIEDGSRPDHKKIALSVKQSSADPWEKDLGFSSGDKVTGRVTRVMSFGAFVEVTPGIEGLIHISELSYTRRVLKVEEIVKPGDPVAVVIKEIDLGGRRISLSLRDAEGDPWLEVKETFAIGQRIAGTVEKKEKFGYFISLAPGITGLLPKSKISRSSQPAVLERLNVGDPITVKIAEINVAERKITLAPADAADEGDWRNFTEDTGKSLGSLGEKLQQALKSGKKTQ